MVNDMERTPEQVRARVFISGMVQGVFFRSSTRDQARRVGVTGWVRNLPDGRVEAIFEGSRSAVQQMIDWCQSGPPGAAVEHVEVQWEDATGAAEPFQIRW
jgi:acylphosphatase